LAPEPKKRIRVPKLVWSCDISIDQEFNIDEEHIFLGVEKVKMSLQSPKMEFEAQNQYDRVIYPSIDNFTWRSKR
jgi:hypothetical protein